MQQLLRQLGHAIGPAVPVFIPVKPLAKAAMPALDRNTQIGVAQHEPLGRDAEYARKIPSNLPRSASRAKFCQYSIVLYAVERSRGCVHIPC